MKIVNRDDGSESLPRAILDLHDIHPVYSHWFDYRQCAVRHHGRKCRFPRYHCDDLPVPCRLQPRPQRLDLP